MVKMQDALEAFTLGFASSRALTPDQEKAAAYAFETDQPLDTTKEKVAPMECSSHMVVSRWHETPEDAVDEFCAALTFPYPSLKHLFDLYWRRMPQLEKEQDFGSDAQKFRASARYVVAVHKVYA